MNAYARLVMDFCTCLPEYQWQMNAEYSIHLKCWPTMLSIRSAHSTPTTKTIPSVRLCQRRWRCQAN
ncbi:hypothetical protein T12_4358 [Trichinella patagoniensis]|uniref:Uncharacterized protein n=1 Tax=Trichinella patagoniensis TaxID=990121 RepID=A0A0V0Z5R4_9BILA|nr:hypothetical protein T12_4358 [Trichinella patagoniensis]